MIEALSKAISTAPYSLSQGAREALLIQGLKELGSIHYKNCSEYKQIIDGAWGDQSLCAELSDFPFLPVSLFKTERLKSIPDSLVRLELTSSGTTGQGVSKVCLDVETSVTQQKALAHSLMHVIGKQRLPMLIIDSKSVIQDPALLSSRGAGVLGFMRYGYHHCFALEDNLSPRIEAVKDFLSKYSSKPFLIFGFTYLVWTRLFEKFSREGLDLSGGILIHSGGWKKMEDKSVNSSTFRHSLESTFGLTRIHNFYGMVEQIGSISLEGPSGLLYPPNFADIIIRDPHTWEPLGIGQPGLIQVLSLLPHSYPGHSLLTEDLGIVEEVDGKGHGWRGKGFKVLGRLHKSETRGCSDSIEDD